MRSRSGHLLGTTLAVLVAVGVLLGSVMWAILRVVALMLAAMIVFMTVFSLVSLPGAPVDGDGRLDARGFRKITLGTTSHTISEDVFTGAGAVVGGAAAMFFTWKVARMTCPGCHGGRHE